VAISKKNISSFITKAFALLLYISFFGVQLFFNFDTGKGPATTIHYYSYNTVNSSFPSHIKQTNKANTKQAIVLLNKRFHPENILAWNNTSIKAPLNYVETTIKYVAFNEHIPSSDHTTYSLRGPPFVV
jgi:hypothetical protein